MMQLTSYQRKGKICIFSGFFPVHSGGAEYQAYLLARKLKDVGYEIFFISIGGHQSGEYEYEGFPIYFLNTNRTLSKLGDVELMLYPKIIEVFRKEKPTVVYSRSSNAVPGILSKLSKKFNYKFIWGVSHDRNVEKTLTSVGIRPFNLLARLARFYGIKKADQIIAQTEYQQNRLKKNFKRSSVVIRNAHPVPGNTIKKPSGILNVFFISNYKSFKRPELYIQLVSKFQEMTNLKFFLIGRTNKNKMWEKELNKAISSYKNFIYMGELSQEEVNNNLEKAHILVNTSEAEGFSNTFIQAWMRKVPVVSLNVDPDKILFKNKIGFCSGSFKYLVEDVRNLVNNQRLREAMGEKAWHYALTHHSIDQASKQFINLLQLYGKSDK